MPSPHPPPAVRRLAAGLALIPAVLLSACLGTITSPGDGDDAICTAEPNPGPATIRRMTRWEYNNTIRDLLGDTSRPADEFVPEEESAGFQNNADALTVSALLAEQYLKAAEGIAERATADLEGLLGCSPDDTCVRDFIGRFGERAYRRPMRDDERDLLFALFAEGRSQFDARTGVEWVVQGMLQSPHFLYRVERGTPVEGARGIAALNSWEVASRLSYFLWGTMPDEGLFAAARADELQTKEQVAAQARRMLADPRAREIVRTFHAQWLDLELVDRIDKDPATFPEFSEEIRSSMRGEIETFIDHVMWEAGGDATLLLTAPYSFVNRELAELYGVPAPQGDGFERVELDPAQRSGLLTQVGLLALKSKTNQTSPIHRGQFVREQILCTTLPPPPPGLVLEVPDPDPDQTTRERFAQHSSDPSCKGCHELMDPIGFGFEAYDGIGRWRSEENGRPIDASGELVATDLPGPFNGAVDLSQQLAQSAQVKECLVRQWFRFAYGRLETNEDECTIAALTENFEQGGNDVIELLVELTLTDAFRYRPSGDNQ